MVPAALEPGTTSALFVSAPYQFQAAAVQPASQAGAPLSINAHLSDAGAPLSMGAHPSQAVAPLCMGAHASEIRAPLSMGAHPFQVGAQFENAQLSQAAAPLVAQLGTPFFANAHLATPVEAQTERSPPTWNG